MSLPYQRTNFGSTKPPGSLHTRTRELPARHIGVFLPPKWLPLHTVISGPLLDSSTRGVHGGYPSHYHYHRPLLSNLESRRPRISATSISYPPSQYQSPPQGSPERVFLLAYAEAGTRIRVVLLSLNRQNRGSGPIPSPALPASAHSPTQTPARHRYQFRDRSCEATTPTAQHQRYPYEITSCGWRVALVMRTPE